MEFGSVAATTASDINWKHHSGKSTDTIRIQKIAHPAEWFLQCPKIALFLDTYLFGRLLNGVMFDVGCH